MNLILSLCVSRSPLLCPTTSFLPLQSWYDRNKSANDIKEPSRSHEPPIAQLFGFRHDSTGSLSTEPQDSSVQCTLYDLRTSRLFLPEFPQIIDEISIVDSESDVARCNVRALSNSLISHYFVLSLGKPYLFRPYLANGSRRGTPYFSTTIASFLFHLGLSVLSGQ